MDADRSKFGSAWRTLRFSLGCLAACCALLVSGCKSDPNRELLEQELRDQEDDIYHLENHLEDFQKQVAALQRENSALRNGEVAPARPSNILSKVGPSNSDDQPATKREGSNSPRSLIAPPQIDLGTPGKKDKSTPAEPMSNKSRPQLSAPGSKETIAPLELPDPTESRPSSEAPLFQPGAQAAPGEQPTQLLLNPKLTGGWAARGSKTDEGIRVLFQPVTAGGKAVRTPGEISVALIDPTLDGDTARVAKWDIPVEQAKELFRQSGNDGVRLELRWPGKPPANNQLQLFVRYRTPHGADLVADQTININTGSSDGVVQHNPYVIRDAGPMSEEPTPATSSSQQRPRLLQRMGDESSRLIGRKPSWAPER